MVLNGGFVNTHAVPACVRCVLVTSGRDGFNTRNPNTTARVLRKEDPSTQVYLFHNPKDNHYFSRMTGSVFGRLMQLAASGFTGDANEEPWPAGAELRVL